MKKYPPLPKKATAQTVASNNIIAYGIFRFHEGMSICRFHELSHSYAVLSLQSGCDIKTVQENLGHYAAAFTLHTYGHVTEQMRRDGAEQINNLIESMEKKMGWSSS